VNFFFHPDTVYFLPVLTMGTAECECCGREAGQMLEVGWGLWSIVFHWGGGAHA
jgi:hypothetical protein